MNNNIWETIIFGLIIIMLFWIASLEWKHYSKHKKKNEYQVEFEIERCFTNGYWYLRDGNIISCVSNSSIIKK